MRRFGKLYFVRRSAALFTVVLASFLFYDSAFAAWGVPDGITDEARKIHDLYVFVLAMAVVVFVAVEGALIFALLRFRRRRDDELPAQTHGSNVLEFLWTGIPVAIVIALFSYSFVVLQDVQEGASEGDLTIEVVGFQFQWEFKYDLADLGTVSSGDQGTFSILGNPQARPELVVPANERVEFKLVSNDVIHSFYVRDFLYKLDLIPGRDNRFVVTPRDVGVYEAQCAELCGVDHAMMRFTLKVVERPEFDAWIDEHAGSASTVRNP